MRKASPPLPLDVGPGEATSTKNIKQWIHKKFQEHTYLYSFCIVRVTSYECHENVSELFEIIKSKGKKPGLALTLTTNIDEEMELLKQSVYVLLLTISNPGSSGQKFDMDGLERIKQINSLPFRKQFMLCVDGGVNENIVNLLDAENIVSGSSVLNNSDPRKQIMRLQTVGRYETG